jgi:transcriptional regulator
VTAVYIPRHFQEDRIDVLHELIQTHGLATLVTYGSSGLIASHVPMLLDPEPAPHGTLRGHLSRANPQWRDYAAEVPALAIFQGTQHYIRPSWYPSKEEHGKTVPTWNYIVVHAYGRLELFEDRALLLKNVRDLTVRHEAEFPVPWGVDDAPPEYVEAQLKGIIGVALRIDRLEGKWKVSQNRSMADRAGVATGLRELDTDESRAMADLVDPSRLEDA